MLSHFIAFSQSYTLSSTFQTHQPDFNYNPQLDFSISDRINTQANFQASTISGVSKSTRTYFRSVIKTKDSTFKDCYAFGVGLTMGSGGAFYLSVSNLDAENTVFESNDALNGGALSLMAGNLLVSTSTFKNNLAYENGGSIYVTSSKYGLFTEIDENIDNAVKFENQPSVYISDNTKFTSNSANNYGGALYSRSVKEMIIKSCIFEQNQVQLAGSAIFLNSTPSNINDNQFNSNICKFKQIQAGSSSIFKQKMFKTSTQANGGAICIYSDSKSTGILTNQNKFDKNAVSGTYSYLMDVPADISFAGNAEIQWISSGACHMNYNLDYPHLITSIKFLDCYSLSPFTNITEKGLGTPSSSNQNFENQNYDDRTSFTPNSLPSTPSPNPEEKPVVI